MDYLHDFGSPTDVSVRSLASRFFFTLKRFRCVLVALFRRRVRRRVRTHFLLSPSLSLSSMSMRTGRFSYGLHSWI
jgi:hypothetical protein